MQNSAKLSREAVKIAIVGIGNCASSLVQGIEYYRSKDRASGLIVEIIGGLAAGCIQVTAAFDIDQRKVGRPLSQAIFAQPNNTLQFWEGALLCDPLVSCGPIFDGVASHMTESQGELSFELSSAIPADVVATLRDAGVEVVVCYLPVGSDEAVRHYAKAAVEAGCAFINCVPVFIANDPAFAKAFEEAGLPLVGDDIRSQVGATIVHQRLTELLVERGYTIDSTYQLNVGGNADFRNMLDRSRLASKKKSKTRAVVDMMGNSANTQDVHIGPSDFIPHLYDEKIAFINLKASGFGGAPLSIDLKLSVQDSPNSAGVVMDLIRYTAVCLDEGLAGNIVPLSSYYMKSPSDRIGDAEAMDILREMGRVPRT